MIKTEPIQINMNTVKMTQGDLVFVLFKQLEYFIINNKRDHIAVIYHVPTGCISHAISNIRNKDYCEFLINLLMIPDPDPITCVSKGLLVTEMMVDPVISFKSYNELYRIVTKICDEMADKAAQEIEPYNAINISYAYEQAMRSITYASNLNNTGQHLYDTFMT